jgi:hypothetical protein
LDKKSKHLTVCGSKQPAKSPRAPLDQLSIVREYAFEQGITQKRQGLPPLIFGSMLVTLYSG